MRMQYNPRLTGDKVQIWKSFLTGSIITSSIIYFVLTENVNVFFAALGLIVIGVILFIETNFSIRKVVFLSQNLFFIVVGGIASMISNATGYLLLYLWIVLILVVVTWLHKFKVRGRIRTS
ncbi:MAG: hypothetical protein V3U72_03660 [Candidatus Aenigmarchaeota archaeon]